ncbi:hypothetical protein Bbelb_016870 [Branchiostoma belcheri]|nr:hypothetical protein Bbelb_016870 [Branchiostoma belcheri]
MDYPGLEPGQSLGGRDLFYSVKEVRPPDGVLASFTASGGTTSAFGRDTLGGGHQQFRRIVIGNGLKGMYGTWTRCEECELPEPRFGWFYMNKAIVKYRWVPTTHLRRDRSGWRSTAPSPASRDRRAAQGVRIQIYAAPERKK